MSENSSLIQELVDDSTEGLNRFWEIAVVVLLSPFLLFGLVVWVLTGGNRGGSQ